MPLKEVKKWLQAFFKYIFLKEGFSSFLVHFFGTLRRCSSTSSVPS
jgi:hypothetical protein